MNIHIATIHERIWPYKCSHCKKEFSQKMNFNRHIAKVHEGKRGQKCSRCNKELGFETDLIQHISSVHDRKRPLECLMCAKEFTKKGSLKRHTKLCTQSKKVYVLRQGPWLKICTCKQKFSVKQVKKEKKRQCAVTSKVINF